MSYQYLTEQAIQQFISNALAEDVGSGDYSSLSSVPDDALNEARLVMKSSGIIAGIALAEKIFNRVNPQLEFNPSFSDGTQVEDGDVIFTVRGNAQSILTGERLTLNCMQRMSGIATITHDLMEKIAHTRAKILDTRKTTPNFRMMEKWAVKIGGGTNHRYGLFDMIMLKDNHIDFAGGITQAVNAAKAYLAKHDLELKIEVETRNLTEVEEAVGLEGVDFIMLDNMDPATMESAVALVNGRCALEASGGITGENIVAAAETGVDFISIGALTHSYKSLDMSLKANI